jgi:hypothetical protein
MPFFVVCVWSLSTQYGSLKEGYLLRQAGMAEEEKLSRAEPYWLSTQNTNATNLYLKKLKLITANEIICRRCNTRYTYV